MERRKLDQSEIDSALAGLNGWSLDGGQIKKEYTFETYKSGLVFAVAVGHLADRMDHHPDLFIGYQKVKVGLNTHDVGGISAWDFELAKQIESLT